jgi:hypothetical protein
MVFDWENRQTTKLPLPKNSAIANNTTGSWSDIEAITQYNSNNKTPIVYCTQLSLLNSYAQNQKKNNSQSNYPILAYVFDDGFRNWCNKKNESLVKSSKDQNLFGHFSDNELPFQDNLIANFLEIKNQQDPAYQIVHKWILEKKIDTTKITKEQKEAFSGFVAELYYKTVAESIKKFDPNQLLWQLGAKQQAQSTMGFIKKAFYHYRILHKSSRFKNGQYHWSRLVGENTRRERNSLSKLLFKSIAKSKLCWLALV